MTFPSFGPSPPYNNPPIQPQYYQPSQFFISAITLGQTTTVTTSVNNNFVVGQLVRLLIPQLYGTRELNEALGYVISIPAPNQVVLNIDSSVRVTTFIANPTFPRFKQIEYAQILAVGDTNTGNINANGPANYSTILPGSFIDISPL